MNFRSVKSALLSELGGFNVLIGKNNTGKSNLLCAIDSFFRVLSRGEILSTNSPIGKALDFHDQTTNILLESSFRLSIEQQAALAGSIAEEAPQVKNAAEGLPATLQLNVTVVIRLRPRRLAFVGELTVQDYSFPTGKRTVLLKVNDPTADELAERHKELHGLKRDVDNVASLLGRFGEEEWRHFRSEFEERRPRQERGVPFSLFHHHFFEDRVQSQELDTALQSAFREEKNFQGFQRALKTFSQRQDEARAAKEQEPLRNPYGTFSGYNAHLPKYASELVKQIGKTKVHYLTDRREPIGKREAMRLLNLKVKRGGAEELQNIQSIVSALLGVRIDAYQGDSSANAESTAELDVDNFLVEANGSGIREALRLILDIEFSHPSIVLVEEPETHLHPALETSLMRYLKRVSARCQVFLTTHSTNFLDTVEMSNVYLVSKKQSTCVSKVGFDEAEERLPTELGLKLSSFFMFDRLVFVEGVIDENVLREWASRTDVNLSLANVGFVPIGGGRNFLYFATEATLAFLRKRGVLMWFILDRDERDAIEIEKLKKALGERARILVLNRREIENYLICPRALSEFIRIKQEMAGRAKALNAPNEEKSKGLWRKPLRN